MSGNEAKTRKDIIDKRLQVAGWNVSDHTQVVEEFDIDVRPRLGVEEPITKYSGHQFSDYVLLGKDGKPLAVVEAKKSAVDANIGKEQAKQYFSDTGRACRRPSKTKGSGNDRDDSKNNGVFEHDDVL